MARLEPFFPKSHGKPRVDDRRVLISIIFRNRNGLRWRDAPAAYGPHKTLYNRWKRWSDKGVFARMMAGLAAEHGEEKTVMIDATYLKAHRTATSMGVKKGAWTPDRSHHGRHEHQVACHLRQPRTSAQPVPSCRFLRSRTCLHSSMNGMPMAFCCARPWLGAARAGCSVTASISPLLQATCSTRRSATARALPFWAARKMRMRRRARFCRRITRRLISCGAARDISTICILAMTAPPS